MRVIADLHGGDPESLLAKTEFQEIRDKVTFEVASNSYCVMQMLIDLTQRESGEERSYTVMWRKYKRRVLLAMSSQAFAQLVGVFLYLVQQFVHFGKQNGINGT